MHEADHTLQIPFWNSELQQHLPPTVESTHTMQALLVPPLHKHKIQAFFSKQNATRGCDVPPQRDAYF